MADQKYPVRITLEGSEKTYSVEFQSTNDFATRWKSVLQKAHKRAVVICLCSGSGERRLAVRHLSSNDTFHLSRYPHSGEEHGLDCVYYSPNPNKSGLGAYSKGVIEETTDGDLKIKLALSLRKKDPPDGEPTAETARSLSPSGNPTKPAMTLLGLLHLLWSEAGLNSWVPAMAGKRSVWLIHHRLIEAANRVLTTRLRIAEVLVVATSSANGQQPEENARKVTSAIKNTRRMLVVAPLAAHTDEREECTAGYLAISGFHGIPRLNIDKDIWANVRRRFKREVSAWSQGKKVIAVVQTDQPAKAFKADTFNADALNIALMVVSSEWIPVDSSYEAAIEAKLRDESRRFSKPLRFDSSEDVVFPDFWLTDVSTNREFPMEVYGRSDPKYLARKAVKTTHYATEYGPNGWWAWDAASDPHGAQIPPFPTARTRT